MRFIKEFYYMVMNYRYDSYLLAVKVGEIQDSLANLELSSSEIKYNKCFESETDEGDTGDNTH